MEKEILSKDLEQILSAGRVAPTACNRQPQRIIVVRRRENRDRRGELIRPYDKKCSGDLDIGIVCDHMMLAARELEIGSVMVGLFDPAVITKEFILPEYLEPTALLFLGYPSKGFLDSERHAEERRPLCETVWYEAYAE